MLPLSDETFAMLVKVHPRWSQARPVIPNYGRPGEHLQPERLGQLVSAALHAADVKASGHSLRHTCATDIVDRGADLQDVQAFLGHTSITATQIWGRTQVPRLREIRAGRRYGPGLEVVKDQTGV